MLINPLGITQEVDPVVGAINGVVKSNGSVISAAVAGTDYLYSNPASGEYRVKKIRLNSDGELVITHSATPEP